MACAAASFLLQCTGASPDMAAYDYLPLRCKGSSTCNQMSLVSWSCAQFVGCALCIACRGCRLAASASGPLEALLPAARRPG